MDWVGWDLSAGHMYIVGNLKRNLLSWQNYPKQNFQQRAENEFSNLG